MAWRAFQMMEATGWQFLPQAGGLLDQPDSLWEDLMVINWRKGCIEEMMKPGVGGDLPQTRT